ncbi:hypothetical protein BDV27DRAFT_153552 [Aspergillus caelatus]|uniref:Uncharacterized protein n=1 Tax=Aspergillus caelatus TaxID=61420 RepID=A0A5N7AIA5_9EURO|nr:uncharacterized protein BDV27DRAFT_153552 [Aspergillus caelatus]KAE8368918.1 hypothetical protein BDV27DRAFT_153552 [Aspergillus caelatus]
MPEPQIDTLSPEWKEDDDATSDCPPGCTLVDMPLCPCDCIIIEEPREKTQSGAPSGANIATATITDPFPVPVETTSLVISPRLSTFDYSKGYRAARDATYVILFSLKVVLLSLAARSYTRRGKEVSWENANMSLPVSDLPNNSPSELEANEKTWHA